MKIMTSQNKVVDIVPTISKGSGCWIARGAVEGKLYASYFSKKPTIREAAYELLRAASHK